MASTYVGDQHFPNYIALSSDIDGDTKIAGCVKVGYTVYLVDTGAWKIIKDDLTVADFKMPAVAA